MEDVIEGKLADRKIDVEGLTKIKAISQSPNADDSDPFIFISEYYANDTDVYTTKAGDIDKAFVWNHDKESISSLKVHGPLVGASADDSGDYAFLKTLPNLRHLDLSEVTDAMVPDGAFADMRLVSVTFPETLRIAGTGIFGEGNTSLCAVQLPSQYNAPANLLEGVSNPNLLLFARSRSLVEDLMRNCGGIITNMVSIDTYKGEVRADEVKLVHGHPFYSPRQFKATNISFTRAFTKETQIGGLGSGWETMVVPFDVETVATGDKRTFKPFGQEDTDNGIYPFWLFRADNGDWKNESVMQANVPYMLAFPNNPSYSDQYCVNGDVVFSATNAEVAVTPSSRDMAYHFGAGNNLEGNYQWTGKQQKLLALNEASADYQSKTYLPGGIFISGERDIPPFECYVESNGAKAIPLFDSSAVEDLIVDFGTRIWGESHSICVRSSIALKLRIYDMVGQLIRIVDVPAGETLRIDGITPGIYFVGSTKILVKG